MKIAGVVLAGGRSSRMGRDKAMLDYKGAPLIDHMINLLHDCGLEDVYVSGDIEGYNCIKDSAKFDGPARAITDVLEHLSGYDGALFIPVDMPLLTQEMLQLLLDSKQGCYFENKPLPALICQPYKKTAAFSVRDLLAEQGAMALTMPQQYEALMRNFNTAQEWAELVNHEC